MQSLDIGGNYPGDPKTNLERPYPNVQSYMDKHESARTLERNDGN